MGVNYHKTTPEMERELAEIEAAKADAGKFSVLYNRYYKPIFLFIYHRTGNDQLTADLCSQVFLKALVYIKKYVYKGVPFSAILYRIAINEINMYFRKHNSERIISLNVADIHELGIVDSNEKDINEDTLTKLTNALGKLSEDSIELIQLRFYEKHSFNEIGNILGITENNAKVKLYRIIDKLKALMGI